MNASVQSLPSAGTAGQILSLSTSELRPSGTQVQSRRRRHYNAQALSELATTIAALGVIEPIIVRPIDPPAEGKTHEIVAGERRWLASQQVNLPAVPAIVRELTDEQVLEVQLVENLKRENLHELEEAEGYEELLKRHDYTTETLALKLGKSRSYVYTRIQLLQLGKKARAAFYKGDLIASVALLLARIPNAELQEEALKAVTETQHGEERMSLREAAQLIERRFMMQLKTARFDTRDAALVPAAGACATCPKRTGAHPELFADIKDKEVCTDRACFHAKLAAHNAALESAALASGRTVVKGDEAARLAPHGGQGNLAGGYIALDAPCWQDEKSRSYRKILGKAVKDPVLIEDARTGEYFEAVRQADYAAELKQALPTRGAGGRNDAQKQKEREARVETLARERILMAVHKSCPKTLAGEDLLAVALTIWHDTPHDAKLRLVKLLAWEGKDVHELVHGGAKRIEKFTAAEQVQLISTCVLVRDVRVAVWSPNKGENLLAAAKRRGVDVVAIRKALKEEIAAKKSGRSGRKVAKKTARKRARRS
jgi:ParB/RepB/Spo0J family partition protein